MDCDGLGQWLQLGHQRFIVSAIYIRQRLNYLSSPTGMDLILKIMVDDGSIRMAMR